MLPVLIAVAGAIGAVARYVADTLLRRRWPGDFPWPTVLINVTGSLLLGVLTGLTVHHVLAGSGTGAQVVSIAGTGFCGGYTTFSAATFETLALLRLRRFGLAAGNALGSVVLTTLAAALGLAVTAW